MLSAMSNRSAVARRSLRAFCAFCTLLLLLTVLSSGQTADLVRMPVNPLNRVQLTGHHPAWASAQNDAGAVPADLPIERLTLVLARPPQVEQAYAQFLKDQQDPALPTTIIGLRPHRLESALEFPRTTFTQLQSGSSRRTSK